MFWGTARSNFSVFSGCGFILVFVLSYRYLSCEIAMMAYKYQVQELMEDYLLSDPLVPYTSVLIGVVLCKMLS